MKTPFICILTLLQFSTAARIKLSREISREYRDIIKDDLSYLKDKSELSSVSDEAKRLFGTGVLGGNEFNGWLQERVNYIINESEKLDDIIYVADNFVTYPNRVKIKIPESPKKPDQEPNEGEKHVMTIMSNVGMAIYYGGKQTGSLLGFKFNGRRVKVKSPRVGLLQVGQGMFHKKQVIGENLESEANKIKRLTTLFHEARHSDGSRESLGFTHALCPEGHDFAGYAACDENLNGPYAIGAEAQKILLNNCETCTEGEKEILRAGIADSLGRIIRFKKAEPILNSEASLYKVELDANKLMLQFASPERKIELEARIAELEELIANEGGEQELIPTTELDPNPEEIL